MCEVLKILGYVFSVCWLDL